MARRGACIGVLLLTAWSTSGCGGGGGGGGRAPAVQATIASGDNQVGTVGTVLAPFVVNVHDPRGAPLAGVQVTFTVSGGGGTLSSVLDTTDAGGDASSVLTLPTTAGRVTVRASVPGAGTSTFVAQAVPAAPVELRFVLQPVDTPVLAIMFPAAAVVVLDAFGNVVVTSTNDVTFALGTNPTGAALGGAALTVPPASGLASITDLTVDRAGQGFTLVASSPGLTSATSAAFDVGAIAAVDGLGHIDEARMSFDRGLEDDALNPSGFDAPEGLAIDRSTHHLFVADGNNNRVLAFPLTTTDGLSARAAAVVLGQPDFASNTARTTSAGLRGPRGLAVDEAGQRLFVADQWNHRVLVFSTAALVSGQAATHVLGQIDFLSGTSGTSQRGMWAPSGVVFHAATQRLFVVDSNNNRVLVFDVASITSFEPAVNVLGQSSYTSSLPWGSGLGGGFDRPQDACLDSASSRLFVADGGDNRVLVFDVGAITDGESATGVLGQANLSNNFSATTRSGLDFPNAVTYEPTAGRLYVSDLLNRRVMVFDVGTVTDGEDAINVIGQTDFVTWQAPSDSRLAVYGAGGLVHADGALLVSMGDGLFGGPHRILTFATAALQDGQPATDGLGHVDGTTMDFARVFANDSPSGATLGAPAAALADPPGQRLFVCDAGNNRILAFPTTPSGDLAGTRAATAVLGQPTLTATSGIGSVDATTVSGPEAMAYDAAGGRLFVADTFASRVLVFDVTTVNDDEPAVHVLGKATFDSASSGVTRNEMVLPSGLAYDAATQRLFVADRGANRVVVFDVATIVDGEDAMNVLGQANFTTSTPATASDRLSAPADVCLDGAAGRLFVADTGNSRVLVFDVTTIADGEAAVNVLGQSNFGSGTAGLGPARVDQPTGLALDGARRRLYVADTGNHRVLRWNVSSLVDGMSAESVLGRPDLTSAAAALGAAGMNDPRGLTLIAGTTTLLVTERGNHRVTVFELP